MGTKDKMSDRDHGDELEPSGSAEEPPAILQGEWAPSVHRLPIWATIREAAQSIAKEWKALLKAIAVPALGLAAINVVWQQPLEAPAFGFLTALFVAAPLLTVVLSFGFLTMIAVSCHRLVILGVDSLPKAWGLYWSRREGGFLGSIIVLYFIPIIPLVLLIILLQDFQEFDTPPEWLQLLGVLFFALALYVLARLSLVLPASAIERPTRSHSWRLTRSNGWRLTLLISPAFLSWILYFVLGEDSPGVFGEVVVPTGIGLHFLAAFTVVLMWVFGIALLSRAFSWFTGEIESSTPS